MASSDSSGQHGPAGGASVDERRSGGDDYGVDPLSSDLDVVSRGQIREMRLPPGWTGGEKENSGTHLYSYQEFHLLNSPSVMIWFFYRGSLVGEEAGLSFR